MASNRFYLLDEHLQPWAIEDPSQEPWPDCRYFAKVLQVVDREQPGLGLRFILTKRITGRLPMEGSDVVVICIGDELCHMPSYAYDVRLVAKTYGVQRTPNMIRVKGRSWTALATTVVQEAIVQARRAPSLARSTAERGRRRRRANVLAIPLGTYLLEDVDFVPFDRRSYDVSFAGSRYNRNAEARRRVPTQKMRSRRELEDVLLALRSTRPQMRLGIHVIDTFAEAVTHSCTYSEMLMDSRVALCPRGGSLETYRFFEALKFGAVPITERLPRRDFFDGAPAVQLQRWSDLPDVLDSLLSDQDGLRELHQRALDWWEERCSPAAVAHHILSTLEVSPTPQSGRGR